jgi:hypothetical protein
VMRFIDSSNDMVDYSDDKVDYSDNNSSDSVIVVTITRNVHGQMHVLARMDAYAYACVCACVHVYMCVCVYVCV